jgi:hypothetical protein
VSGSPPVALISDALARRYWPDGNPLRDSLLIGGLLFGVSQHDAASIVTVVVILGSVTMIAAWIPATRASAVEPVIALRAE